MTDSDLLIYGVPSVVAILAGGSAGGFVAWKFRRSQPAAELVTVETENDVSDDTEFVHAAIDMAAVKYTEDHDLPPQAASLIAEKLKVLHKIGKGKRWF